MLGRFKSVIEKRFFRDASVKKRATTGVKLFSSCGGAVRGDTFLTRANGCRLAVAALAGIVVCAPLVFAADKNGPTATVASENELLATIERLGGSLDTDMPLELRLQLNAGQLREIVARADEFLSRFANSHERDRVLIAKITALAELARTREEYLDQLLSLTAEVAGGSPAEPLASENAFYAIHAFVIGARNEKMDAAQRLRGTMERYRAFLKDHSHSRWTPIVWASLVRNLLVQRRIDEARREVEKLEKVYPTHRAAQRARGELFRATAIGKPFAVTATLPNGETLNTAKYKGRVLVLHFWSSTNAHALSGLDTLRELFDALGAKRLALVGINLDADKAMFRQTLQRLALPWPQFHEPGGLAGDLVVGLGVIRIPTYYVVDPKGTLRYTNPGSRLAQVVEGLVTQIAAER